MKSQILRSAGTGKMLSYRLHLSLPPLSEGINHSQLGRNDKHSASQKEKPARFGLQDRTLFCSKEIRLPSSVCFAERRSDSSDIVNARSFLEPFYLPDLQSTEEHGAWQADYITTLGWI